MKYLLMLIVSLTTGCASYFSARDAHLAREYLTADIEDEVVFNLIRAKNGLPFAHYDVSSVQSVVTDKLIPNVGASRNGVSNHFLPGAVADSAVHMITRTFTGGVSAERDNAVTVSISPVFSEPAVYAAYVNYLNLPAKPATDTTVRVSPTPRPSSMPAPTPVTVSTKTTTKYGAFGAAVTAKEVEVNEQPPSQALPKVDFRKIYSVMECSHEPADTLCVPHTKRKWDNDWYYIPVQYRPEFSDLCLSLVARAGKKAGGDASKAQEETTRQLQELNSRLL
jgi:hypothetical protein